MMALLECQKCDEICTRLDAGQWRDGRNWYNNISLCIHSMLTRDKNGIINRSEYCTVLYPWFFRTVSAGVGQS